MKEKSRKTSCAKLDGRFRPRYSGVRPIGLALSIGFWPKSPVNRLLDRTTGLWQKKEHRHWRRVRESEAVPHGSLQAPSATANHEQKDRRQCWYCPEKKTRALSSTMTSR